MPQSLFGFSLTSPPLVYVAQVEAYKFSVEVVALDPVRFSPSQPFNKPGGVELPTVSKAALSMGRSSFFRSEAPSA